jgi:hypothetical protein
MKLRRPLAEYLQQVEESLGALRDAYVECYLEEVLTPERANLRVRVRFQNGRLLEINEAVVADDDASTHLDYRYRCQDSQNRIVFRYDSTPHFPDLPTFPHHKHLPDSTIPATRPSISRLLAEAAEKQAG